MNRLCWYLKQLLPLFYQSRYELHDGTKCFAVWRMWFGRVFDYEVYTTGPDEFDPTYVLHGWFWPIVEVGGEE